MSSDTSSEPVLSFQDVSIGFDEGEVLKGLSFSVAPRETKVLIGESGTGKTLTLKLAAGLLADSGSVRMLGQDLGAMSEKELLVFRRRIGFVFQEGALFDSLSVAENVAYCLREEHVERKRFSRAFWDAEVRRDGRHNGKIAVGLSGGMRRRVSIARALVSRPGVVLYDSPTAGLDPVTSQTIITLILRLRDTQGVTSMIATHRLQDAFGLANYRFDGEWVAWCPSPTTAFRERLLRQRTSSCCAPEKPISKGARRPLRIPGTTICSAFCCNVEIIPEFGGGG